LADTGKLRLLVLIEHQGHGEAPLQFATSFRKAAFSACKAFDLLPCVRAFQDARDLFGFRDTPTAG